MEANKVLFATDLSELSSAGLHYASWLAQAAQARLLIVHVQEPPPSGERQLYEGLPGIDPDAPRRALEALQPPLADVPYEHHLLTGKPAEAIVKLAQEENADLIVIGTHGRTGLRRLLMGSVAEEVVRKAPCPVLTFRLPAAG